MIEFTFGCCCTKISAQLKKINSGVWFAGIGVTFLAYYFLNSEVKVFINNSTYFNPLSIISCFFIITFGLILDDHSVAEKIGKNSVILFLSNYSFEIYCVTGVSFLCYSFLLQQINDNLSILFRVILSVGLCIVCAIVLKYVGKIQKIFGLKIGIKKYVMIYLVIFASIFLYKYVKLSQPKYNFNIEQNDIDTFPIKGVYYDEGTYAWAGEKVDVKIKNKKETMLVIKLNTNDAVTPEGVEVDLYVDDAPEGTYFVNGETVIKANVNEFGNHRVVLTSHSDVILSNDARQLSYMLQYIGFDEK